jgi:23S rRNA (guanine2445-N2)-methyltransferase / 23S rRNA (guanine2069-N7)-methyltransferase
MTTTLNFFAPCPRGIEALLTEELRSLHMHEVKETRAGVAFQGSLQDAYRVCLWSRLASRVLLTLKQFPIHSAQDLYEQTLTITWQDHLSATGTLAVDFTGTSPIITHTHFGALKVKDAIVDQLRAAHNERPSIDTEQPDVRINVYLQREIVTLSLDLSGASLHRRGYRTDTVEAPLKENLASAILLRANWPTIAAAGGSFVDLMCGSGTLCIEAAYMAGDIAPGILRDYFGFRHWQGHDAAAWKALLIEAHERKAAGLTKLPAIVGYDQDQHAIRSARGNAKNAGLDKHIAFTQRELSQCTAETIPVGLMLCNPPYGERMGEANELPTLYRQIGDQLKQCFPQWRAAIFTGNPDMGRFVGLRPQRKHTLYNGSIECKLFHYIVTEEGYAKVDNKPDAPKTFSVSAEMFANRLQKDIKLFTRWSQREGLHCYRLYDADMPEYNLAIDVYQSDKLYLHIQEYEAPKTIDPAKAHQRLTEALAIVYDVMQVPRDQVFFKQRRQQKSGKQYEKFAETGQFHEVAEGPGRFWVNFTDYLDTGLFLDHRLTRLMILELAQGKRFLNLFAYTGTATVYAALGGATTTTTVDMSNTYLTWAEKNLALNHLKGKQHEFIQADVLTWLLANHQRRFDLIFLDPPTFSRSKRMQDTLDIQRDHVELIRNSMALLAEDGVLLFSNNHQKFKLDKEALADLDVGDITQQTLPKDFERNPKIHHCFRITRRINTVTSSRS